MMNCNSCGENFESNDFIYCPYCGDDLTGSLDVEDKFTGFFEKFLDSMGDDLFDLFESDALKIFVNGKKFDFNSKKSRVVSKVKKANKKTQVKKKLIAKKQVIEPLVSVIKDREGVSLEVSLPGVKDEDNVLVTEREKSLEVMANSDDKTFFTSIQKPKKLEIIEEFFQENVLLIRLE